jgi:hypothetical protein
MPRLAIVSFLLCLFVSPASAENKTVTIINDSKLTLRPTAEGVTGGCLGGSIPYTVVMPGRTEAITIIFVSYLPSCRFNVLPAPQIITYLNGCHGVKAGDTVTFTGGAAVVNVRCQIAGNYNGSD